MRVEIVSGSGQLRALGHQWQSLTSQLSFKRHHHLFEWNLALAEAFEENNWDTPPQYIAAFSNHDALAAVIPFQFLLLKAESLQLKVIRLMPDQEGGHSARDIVIEPTLVRTDFLQEVVRHLAEIDPRWDAILFEDNLEDSLATAALQHFSRLPFFQTQGGAWGRMEFLSCGEQDRPFERLSKGFRQNLRTGHNKLRAQNVTFEMARTESDLANLLTDFLRVESSGWKGELGTSALQHSPTQSFLRSLIKHLGPKEACEIHVMRVGGQPISSLFGVVIDRVWFVLRTGYDESYHRVSPGHLIIENLLRENAVKERFGTLTTYNAPPWFYAWKPDRTLKVYNSWVFRPSQRSFDLGQKLRAMFQSGLLQYPPGPESTFTIQWFPYGGESSKFGPVSRNALCPCGSGKRYKHCHGAL